VADVVAEAGAEVAVADSEVSAVLAAVEAVVLVEVVQVEVFK